MNSDHVAWRVRVCMYVSNATGMQIANIFPVGAALLVRVVY